MFTSYYSNYQTSNRLANEISYDQYSSKYSNPYLSQSNQLYQHQQLLLNNNSNININFSNQNLLNRPVENNCSIYQSFESDNSKLEEWNKIR